MLDQVNKNIQRYVDNAGYFTDVREWYAYKFLLPYTLRSYLLFVFLATFLAAYIMYEIVRQDAKSLITPFPLYAYDSVNYFPNIQPLSEIKEPINVSIARYMLSHFVKFREGYSYSSFQSEDLNVTLSKIRQLSSLKVFRDFKDYVSTDNPDSPLIKYKDKTKRIINVKSVELFGPYDLPERAKVTFEAIEKSKINEEKSTWVAEINFKMLDLEKKGPDGKPVFNFTVIHYSTYKL